VDINNYFVKFLNRLADQAQGDALASGKLKLKKIEIPNKDDVAISKACNASSENPRHKIPQIGRFLGVVDNGKGLDEYRPERLEAFNRIQTFLHRHPEVLEGEVVDLFRDSNFLEAAV